LDLPFVSSELLTSSQLCKQMLSSFLDVSQLIGAIALDFDKLSLFTYSLSGVDLVWGAIIIEVDDLVTLDYSLGDSGIHLGCD
jgi:hypothetical protein